VKQEGLELPLAGTVADVRDRLEQENPKWANRPTYTCMCCGARYRRREWKCCNPPGGMSAQVWLSRHHRDCTTAENPGPGNSRCPHHCRCQLYRDNNLPIPPLPAEPTIAQTKAVVDQVRAGAASGRRSTPPMDPDDPFLQSELPEPSGEGAKKLWPAK
jgi:hypothetical protein